MSNKQRVNLDALKTKLNKYINSEKGREKIKQERIKAFDANKNFGKSEFGITNKYFYSALGDAFMMHLDNEIFTDPRSSNGLKDISSKLINSSEGYIVSNPIKIDDDLYKVYITFNKEMLRRKSLKAENFQGDTYYTGEGINNILALFNNGMDISAEKQAEMYGHSYSGSGAPFGLWETHNIMVRATTHRDPLLFMQRTAREFLRDNEKYNIVSVDISDIYKKA